MPFIYDLTQQEWPDDAPRDYEPSPPRVDQFEYLTPPDFGGAIEPVSFAEIMVDPVEDDYQEHRRGLLSSLRMIFSPRFRQRMIIEQFKERWRNQGRTKEQQFEAKTRTAMMMRIVVEGLQRIGGTHVHCGYDGGNDEGFAWFLSLTTTDGGISLDDCCSKLLGLGCLGKLREEGLVHENPRWPKSDLEQMKNFVQYWLVEEWATRMLGYGFGTGEFQMFGSFTVDLQKLTITDDRAAEIPKNGNYSIAPAED